MNYTFWRLAILFLLPISVAITLLLFQPHWPRPLPRYQHLQSLPVQEQLQNIFLSWIYPSLSSLNADERPSVVLRQGTFIGTVLINDLPAPVEVFLGIPYAQPPVGKRRFRPPVPVNESFTEDAVDASFHKKRCPASAPSWGDDSWDEDCLHLNIFRPKLDYKSYKRLPVAVYFHGGAFNAGAGRDHNSASMMAWSEKPYVAVNFNYRLGALGFLTSEIAAKDGSLNAGLYDQIMLLEWVQNNIENFGGDPDQITLIGLSAGAHSIGHHIMNIKRSTPLFHRAILESGAATARAVYPYNNGLHETQFEEFLAELSCGGLRDEEIIPCLRSKPATEIVRASVDIFGRYYSSDRWAFQPAIDGNIIKQAPIRSWESHRWNRVPVLTGFNTNEGSPFVPSMISESNDFVRFFSDLIPSMSNHDLQTLDLLYPDPVKYHSSPYMETRNITIGRQFKRLEAAYAHFAYVCPVRQTAHLASIIQDEPVYLYNWALNKTVKGGASHGDQVDYETYDKGVRAISEAQTVISGILHAYFTSFITTGDPNTVKGRYPSRPVWTEFKPKYNLKKLMLFGDGNDERAGGQGVGVPAQMVDDSRYQGKCEFWSERSILTES